MARRIGIDCRLAGVKHAGIGRYIQNIVRHCVTDDRFEWVLFFHNARQANEVLPGKTPRVKRVYVTARHYSMLEQLVIPYLFWREKLTLLHVPHFNIPLLYPGKMVITIHDLLWHEQRGPAVTTLPSWQYWPKYAAYKLIVAQAVSRAKAIFVPTKTVKKTLARYYPHTESKIHLTPEGVDKAYQITSKTPTDHPTKQLVYTGSLYPHKNVKLIVQALSFLPDFTLVIVGSRTVFQDSLKEFVSQQGVEQRVKFAGFLSDQDLITLYQRSYALVFPSVSEGFGLPGLEAMAAGLPVIAADIPVFREVYGRAAAFFNPYSVAEFVETVRTLEPSRSTLITAGWKQARRFQWDTTARLTLEQYQLLTQ